MRMLQLAQANSIIPILPKDDSDDSEYESDQDDFEGIHSSDDEGDSPAPSIASDMEDVAIILDEEIDEKYDYYFEYGKF